MNNELDNKYGAIVALDSAILYQKFSQEKNRKLHQGSWFPDYLYPQKC
jgi:hypothetical protein